MTPAQKQESRAAYVYFIQAGTNGPIKIGWAYSPKLRVAELQTGNHETLRIIGTVEGDADLERLIHDRLAGVRRRGEWFDNTPEVQAVMADYFARPTNHVRIVVHPTNGQRCTNCDALLTDFDDRFNDNADCLACREFAELRAAGIDPFDEE